MRKYVVMGALAVGAVAVGVGVWSMKAPPEQAACERIRDLCGMADDDFASCVTDLRDLRAEGGRHAEKLDTCVLASDTCGEATGCVAGTGLRVLGGEIGDFFKGIGNSWKK